MRNELARVKAVTKIKQTNGRFFSVKFEKKNGDLRTMNARMKVESRRVGGVNKVVKDSNSYITVFDTNAPAPKREVELAKIEQRKARRGDYRTVNIATLVSLKCGGVEYIITD